MNKRVSAFFPFSVDSGILSKTGQSPVYSGALTASEVVYGLHEATGLSATVRPHCDGPHTGVLGTSNPNIYSGAVAVERATSNLLVTSYSMDALQLSNWNVFGGAGVTVTTDFCAGPWGSSGPTATKIVKDATGSNITFYYNTGSTSVLNTNYMYTCYVKVLSGTLVFASNGGSTQTITTASGWVRPELLFVGDGAASVQINFRTQNIGDAVTFLACCAQIESSTTLDFATSFVNGSRDRGSVIEFPSSIIEDSQNFSFSTWLAPHEANTSSNRDILAVAEYNALGGYIWVTHIGTNIRVYYPTDEATRPFQAYSVSSWSDKEWHKFELKIDSGVGTVYLDGTKQVTTFSTVRKFIPNRISIGGWVYSAAEYYEGLMSDCCFFNSPLSDSSFSNLYAAYGSSTPSPMFNDLSLSTLPQPTESAAASATSPVVRVVTESGKQYVDSVNSVANEEVSLHYGPLQSTDVYLIRDFYDANGEYGTFDFTPLDGAKGLWRFSSKGLQIKTTRPSLHEISATIEKVN